MARTKQTRRYPGGYEPRKRPRERTQSEEEAAEEKRAEGPVQTVDRPSPGPYPVKAGGHGWCQLTVLAPERLSWYEIKRDGHNTERCVAVSTAAGTIQCELSQQCYTTEGVNLINDWRETRTG